MKDLVLPAFEMDCRDWLVLTPAQAGLPDEIAGSPLLAVLSTLVIGHDSLREASGVLTIGLLDDELPSTRPVARGCVAAELVDADAPADSLQYVLATPDGQLALLAEFTMPDGIDGEVVRRIEMLMKSFRWAI
ncbi:MAG: hypothetical protein DLM58_12330 [Pseudonocardiales bacterium]|nr:MAG: hypothetical protein DLM58_12330 [Pseudonocardiales bacterium]